jgi:hypothetical protein
VASKNKPTITGGTNNEELLQMAIRAAKTGQKDGARVMLQQLIDRDKHNERALMWMAKLAPNNQERQKWLQRVLKINADNEAASEALEKLRYKEASQQNRLLFRLLPIIVIIAIVAIGLVFVLLSIGQT